MNFFLKIKHWQLFLLLIGIPIVFQIFVTYMMVVTRSPRILFLSMPVLMIMEVAILYGWLYSLGVSLNKLLPAEFKMKVNRFKAFAIIPIIYISLISVFLFDFISNYHFSYRADPYKMMAIFATIVPVHMFVMFCIFYCFWFIGKSLKTIEMKKEVKFEDYVGEFFLLWFFIVGVWIIQPRINKLFDESLKESETLDGNIM